MLLKATNPAAVFRIALGQIVPHDHHGDAPRQPDHDQTDHVLGMTVQKNRTGQREHQNWSDDPVLDERQGKHFPVVKHVAQFLVLHFCQRRVHHQDQAQRDGKVGGIHLKAVDKRSDTGQEMP